MDYHDVYDQNRVLVKAEYLRREGLRAAVAQLVTDENVTPAAGRALLGLINGDDLDGVREVIKALGGRIHNSYCEWGL